MNIEESQFGPPMGKHIAYAQADKRKAIFAFGARFAPTVEHMLYIATPNGDFH